MVINMSMPFKTCYLASISSFLMIQTSNAIESSHLRSCMCIHINIYIYIIYPTLMAYTGCALDFLVTKRVFGGAGLYKSRNLPKKTLNKISTKSTAQPTCPGAPVPYFITRKSLGQPLLPKRYHCKNILDIYMHEFMKNISIF